jgi:hypothetical protein
VDPLGPEFERQLDGLGGPGSLSELVRLWPRVVGDAIARNTCPARITRDGSLRVHTSSSTWAFELAQLAPRIGERLREALGERAPRRLRFVPGPVPEGALDDSPASIAKPPPATAEQRRRAAELARSIGSPALRELVARAAAASLAAAASDRRF